APLPEVVVVDLGDRGAEAILELRLRRLDVLALALQRAGVRKVQLDREDADVARAHAVIQPNRAAHESSRSRAQKFQSRFTPVRPKAITSSTRVEGGTPPSIGWGCVGTASADMAKAQTEASGRSAR